jgi:hypothetical protein
MPALTQVRNAESRAAQVSGQQFPASEEEDLPAPCTFFGFYHIDEFHGEFKVEPGLWKFAFTDRRAAFVKPRDQLHHLERARPQFVEPLEDEIIEDKPGKISPFDIFLHIVSLLFELFEYAAAERAFSPDQLIEEDFFAAPWTGGMRSEHACHGKISQRVRTGRLSNVFSIGDGHT